MSRNARRTVIYEVALREDIEQMIFSIRGQRVMIDRDLARLYGVETKYLNRQVKRNYERFPAEFMFQLTLNERHELVTNWHRFSTLKHSSSLPFAFTENGVAMLASVLNSERAIKISIHIIKIFVKLRQWVSTHKELSRKLNQLEARVEQHDEEIRSIFQALHELIEPKNPLTPKRKIGFHRE